MRRLTILAQDPSVLGDGGAALTTTLAIPEERLSPGPRGARIEVIDYDATAGAFYKAADLGAEGDLFEGVTDVEALTSNAHFHAQNVYAIAAHALATFENALGRRVPWGFPYGTHQIKILPHAFADTNAFYSRRDEALLFGYFHPSMEKKAKPAFTCLSRDIVAHETAHALLDGLKRQLDRPSSLDQGAFHEGYADIVALLSVLQSKELLEVALKQAKDGRLIGKDGTVRLGDALSCLESSFLLGLAEQFGVATNALRRDALRRSTEITPSPDLLDSPAYEEAHDRGELIAAMVLRAFLAVWRSRLLGETSERGGPTDARKVEAWRVAEEGATAAGHLLRMMVRALDYLPPAHVTFGDVLSAVLSADHEAYPDDSRYQYRPTLIEAFAAFGVEPCSTGGAAPGVWEPPDHAARYDFVRHDALRHDRTEMARFIHDNRDAFGLVDGALTMVDSVDPAVRTGDDGFILRETIAQYFQLIEVDRAQLKGLGVRPPKFMRDGDRVQLHGGGTLIFDEFGRLKFHIRNRLNHRKQSERLENLWKRGALDVDRRRRFATAHMARALGATRDSRDWS